MNLSPLNEKMLHGGDYNPDQWLDRPDILKQDIVLMKEAHVNCVSVAIFAWAQLEPQEGVYDFGWLGRIIGQLYENGIYTILATPTGARPAWMAQKYPEVLRVDSSLHRNHMGERHNHCYTSPVYREKARQINVRLSQAFGKHPGVILWHISNEYGGECYCELCQEAFRQWLKEKYRTLEALNHAWWIGFWSHTYTDWSQIEPPLPRGESHCHGLSLDWKRFVTHQTVDFCQKEIEAVREGGSQLPATTNLMGFYKDLNYNKFQDVLDIISWDNYPDWHGPQDPVDLAAEIACTHDLMRCINQKPFLLMESTPSTVNWRSASKLKRPGMHMLSSLQAVAHGSNSVQYFQWRKGRGACEKFHGAVLDHYGKSDTRVFQETARLGNRLEGLSQVCKTNLKPQAAILFDWENWWAAEDSQGPRNSGLHYKETVLAHYRAFWKLGIPVDIIDMEKELSGYQLVVAPMLYLYRANIAEKMKKFVELGGTLVGTYWSGIVNDTDLCYLGGMPGGGMAEVFGLRSEEIDALYDGQYNAMSFQGVRYRISELCDLVKTNTAAVLSTYEDDFYAGQPSLTVNRYGKGKAYYLAAKAEDTFYVDFYRLLAEENGVAPALDGRLPHGVTASLRKGSQDIVIVQNYNEKPAAVPLNASYTDLETGNVLSGTLELSEYGVAFLIKAEL